MKKKNHYIDNKAFLEAIIERKKLLKEAEEKGIDPPIISNYLGKCILDIATHLSYSPKFNRYTYREEMVSDGIENCILYFDKFDADNYSNPFAYFTQIVYFAFLRRLAKEKQQTYVKGKILQELPFDLYELQDHDEDGTFTNTYIEFMQNNDITNMEIKKKVPVVKPKNKLEEYIDG